MILYNYEDVPNLKKSIVDMANRSPLEGYNKGARSYDSFIACSILDAQNRIHLELLKMQKPNQTISSINWWYGFVAKDCTSHNPQNDVERLLTERNRLRTLKIYKEADDIRNMLISWGYTIEGEASGTNRSRLF